MPSKPSILGKILRHIRFLLSSPDVSGRIDLSGRNVLITGVAFKSIGYETARILATWGANVTGTTLHNPSELQASLRQAISGADSHGEVLVHRLDLCDYSGTEEFVEFYKTTIGSSLHVLVNNAGVHRNILNPRERPPTASDGLEIHWRTNFLGSFHLTQRMLPLLINGATQSRSARVVNVSSHIHEFVRNEDVFADPNPYHSWSAYAVSKLALVHLSQELQRRYAQEFNIQSYALHPGSAYTNMTYPEAQTRDLGNFLDRVSRRLASLVLLSPGQAAQTSVMCASNENLKGGTYYDQCELKQLSPAASDKEFSAQLWEYANHWLESETLNGKKLNG